MSLSRLPFFFIILWLVLAACAPKTAPAPLVVSTGTAQGALTKGAPTMEVIPTLTPTQAHSPTPSPDLPPPAGSPTTSPTPTGPLLTKPPTPKATTGDGISTDWVWIAMFDERNGWGQTDRGILITTDGGAHWEDVTPQRISGSDRSFSAFFLDASTSWVSARMDDPHLILFHTADGGHTWESVATPVSHGYVFFVDPENGWILDASSCGVGSCDGNIYRTTDGGTSWEQIHSFGPSPEDDPNAIPYGGIKDRIAFSDARHGWLTGSIPVPSFVYLYATRDGGITWQHQDIPRPPGAEKEDVSLAPPQFFSVQEGFLPVVFHLDPPELVFYMTRDGGATWKETTSLEKSEYRTVYDCVSLQECWVVAGDTLMVSHDSAQTWAQISPNIKMGGVWELEFVSSRTGWALRREQSEKDQLYRTDDGGLTWNPLLP